MCENRLQDPNVRRLWSLGVLLSVVSPSLPRFFHPTGRLEQDLLDGLCGLLAGIGIGILITLLAKMSRQRRAGAA